MEYTVKKLAALAGVSPRTLRFYDEKGLLTPARVSSSGYRIYGAAEVDRLQRILFYRELGVELDKIKEALDSPQDDPAAVLREQLLVLKAEQERLTRLIANVEKTIMTKEGLMKMSDKEKFEGLKKSRVEENEKKYGAEIREKYGDKAVDEANAKMMGLNEGQYDRLEALHAQISEKLEAAVSAGLAADSKEAAGIVALHREMLELSWPKGMYTREAHIGMGEMYVADERFTAYYDKRLPGCAAFLCAAIKANA